MAEAKPVLQKPPGYRDPNVPIPKQRPALPPRKPNLPPSFYPRKRRKCSCCLFCCWFVIVILLLILLVAAAGGIFYLLFQPMLPVFHLKSLQFPKFNVTSSPDGPTLNVESTASVEITNPNKELKVIYDKTQVILNDEANEVGLGSASLPAFTQQKGNVTVVKFSTRVKNLLIDENTSRKLKDGFRSKNLAVSTEVRTGVGIGGNGWSTGTVSVRVICGALSLKQAERGATPKCRINVFRWFILN